MSTLAEFVADKSNPIGYVNVGLREFLVDSKRMLQKCNKPDSKEFRKVAAACAAV